MTSETTQNVVLVDIAQGRVLAAIPTKHPGSHMLGVTADGKHLFTSNIGWGGISEIDLEKRAFVRDLQVSAMTEGVAVAPDGSTVWLGANQAGTVSVIDTKSLERCRDAHRTSACPIASASRPTDRSP